MITRRDLTDALGGYVQAADELAEALHKAQNHGGSKGTTAAAKTAQEVAVELRKTLGLHEEVIWRMFQQAIADELDAHSQHFWDIASMYESTTEALTQHGEENGAMVTAGTVRVCRDVAKRLRTRAAQLAGDDPATLGLLTPPSGGDGYGS